jgi:chemotaxis-related protein WspB
MQLFLQIRTGTQGYLLETRYVTRVLPLMRIRSVPPVIAGLSGIINYQGSPVPVLDFCELLFQRPAVRQVSTRLILINLASFPAAELLCTDRVALLAEGVSDVIRLAPSDFLESVRPEGARYLGPMANVEGHFLQRIELEELLSSERIPMLRIDSGDAA